ncbi:type II toxin-antitoxin system Phd/YefM family antitoxin [Rathayibacter soli]|uniref:type II toxin-antitoxin system Phd/YefM family antitoxin n=1 Tax=Rathayibacter soli TaxID=3144168 RepID=UPI0027E4F92A|nr:hypothetical protein [Glaciibacter superstes]
MKTISQRELRNNSGEIMRGLARGESYRVASRGIPVGILSPSEHSALDELTLRAPKGDMVFPEGVRVSERTDDALAELRAEG